MMRRVHFCLLLSSVFWFGIGIAQPQKKLWSLPDNYIKFNPGPGALLFLPMLDFQGNDPQYDYPHNAVHDANGNLSFFVSSSYVTGYGAFDKNGKLIAALTYQGVPVQDGAEVAIVPVPGSCSKFYIILSINGCTTDPSCYSKFGYEILDLSQTGANGSLGKLLNNGVVTLLKSSLNFGVKGGMAAFAVTPLRAPTNDRLLFATQAGLIYKFAITSAGITELTSSGDPLTTPGNNNSPLSKSELEVIHLSNGNYRLGYANWTSVGVSDFDPSGTLIGGTTKIFTPSGPAYKAVHGLEFSLNGMYLYYSHELSPWLEYIDVTQATLTSNNLGVANSNLFDKGQIELGYDGKLYFAYNGQLASLGLNANGSPNTASWNDAAVTGLSMSFPYLNDQVDGEVYFPAAPTISGNTYACSTGTEVYSLSGNYNPAYTYMWTVTGGTPSSFITTGTTQSQPITWNAGGGTITVQAAGFGCNPTTFTVNSCCRLSPPEPQTTQVVYFTNKVENANVTYTATFNGTTTAPPGVSYFYVINGTYTINANAVTYSGCQTYFAPNVPVNVNAGGYLKLINGTVWQAGCGSMWNGVTVVPGSNMLVDNSTIQDAKLAIDSKNGAPFTVQNNSKLNINYRNILLEAYTGTHPAVIKNSQITCLSTTTGQPANALIAPYAGQRTAYGFELNGVKQAQVGLDQVSQSNTFNNMNVGIYSFNSSVTIFNNSFTNITNATGLGRCIMATCNISTEQTIVVGGDANTYQDNTFTNSYYGMYMSGRLDASVKSNTFNNLTYGIYFSSIRYQGNTMLVTGNKVIDCLYGVRGTYLDGSSSITIVENNFNQQAPGPNSKPNSKAISISNSTLSSMNSPVVSLLNNLVSRTAIGIECINFTHPVIESNDINTISDLGSGVLTNGIYVMTCPNAEVNDNNVSGSTSASWYMNGIRVEFSGYSKVLRNYVSDIGRGLFFGGVCTGTETAKNNMKNNYDGFFLNYGIIGPQLDFAGCTGRATENTWEGTFVRGHLFSQNSDGTQSPMNLYLANPQCNPVNGPCTDPVNLVSGSNQVGSGVFPIPTYRCTTPSGYRTADPKKEMYMKIAKNQIQFPAYNTSAQWMNKYTAYLNLLGKDSTYKNDPELSAFVDSVANTAMGSLYTAGKNLASGNASKTNAALTKHNTTTVVEQNLKDVYTIDLSNRNNGGLSKAEIKALQRIAKQCPYEGGYGVYNARVLLSTFDNTIYTNPCEAGADKKSNLKLAQEQAEPVEDVVIYPNPANDKLYLNLSDGQTGKLEVYGLTGALVLSTTLISENQEHISTAHLSEGLYFYKVYENDRIVNSGKLSIIR